MDSLAAIAAFCKLRSGCDLESTSGPFNGETRTGTSERSERTEKLR